MRKLMRKAAFMAAKKASKGMLCNIGQIGANLIPGLSGEIELKNGRRIVVESVGTGAEPKFFISVKAKNNNPKKAFMRIIALILGCIGGAVLVNKVLSD